MGVTAPQTSAPVKTRLRPASLALAAFRRVQWLSILLVLAALAPLAAFFVVPLLDVAVRSLTPDGTLTFSHWSMSQYKALFQDDGTRRILLNTFTIAVEATVLTVVIAFPMGMYLYQMPRGRALIILGALLLPSWSSFIVALYGLSLLLQPLGLLYTQRGTVIGMVNYLLPYMVVMLFSAMVAVDPQLFDSARSLGANWFQAFLRVFWPLVRPGLFSGALIIFIIGLAFFLTPAILGGPSDLTAAMFIQQEIQILNWSSASAMGITLLFAAVMLYAIVGWIGGLDRVTGQSLGGRRGAAASSDEPWPRAFVWFLRLWMVVTVCFVFAPILALIPASLNSGAFLSLTPSHPSLSWYSQVKADTAWQTSGWLSLKVGVLAASGATFIGFAGAFTLTRILRFGKSLLRIVLVGPLIVPVILYAIAIFDLESRMRITGSILGFAIAHMTMAVPFTVTILSNAMDAVGMDAEEAARSLGASRSRALFGTTVRLILPSILSAWALAFFLSWGETVVALILAGATQTLPVRIFNFMQVELTPETAALGTVITLGVILVAIAAFFVVRTGFVGAVWSRVSEARMG